ncbi:hypothetical protein AZI85_03500 [Bdellovibrio bacteriovorus]|uniref:Bdellovibrio beta-sandwich domain-containing protein n=1 Tax=Bdellovibrio bacteriovorus TaxID=959 RepID=A0A150WKS7_BDEBC|nr:beta-sandwich domain-containing protein [Bdellovibrio bacteriovorus]KYG64492.1 hypothetical protein AZI85_03500 [Bdellovibrio bacteriovorus]
MKAFTKTLMAMSLLTSHLAQASGIEDLPGFDEETTQTPAPVLTPAVPTQNTQASNLLAGSVSINSISRKSNGTLYTVDLKQALSLVRIDLRVTAQKLKLHRVTLVTDTGARVNTRQLENSDVLEAGNVLSSETLNQSDRVVSIEVVAESYGAEANILLTAIADREVPVMKLRTVTAPVQPTRPTPPAPPTPQRPDSTRPPVYQDTRLNRGDDVISGPFSDGKYYFGKVVEIFNNGQILVRDNDDGKSYTRNSNIVSKRVRCDVSGVYCQGVRVLSGPFTDNKFYTGVIHSVYVNGLVFVTDDDDGKVYRRETKIIALASKCAASGHCAGDNVISGPFSGKYYNGVVEGGYSNGLIAVRDADDGKVYYRNASVVLKSLRCDQASGLCINTEVISGPFTNNKYYSGVITGIYSNGVIYVRDHDDGKVYARKASDLSKRLRCEQKKGLCEGARVVSGPYRNGTYYAGTVVRIYANGLIQVRDDDDGKIYDRKASELSGIRN